MRPSIAALGLVALPSAVHSADPVPPASPSPSIPSPVTVRPAPASSADTPDSGAYVSLRRAVHDGVTPPRSALTVHSLLAAFDWDLPDPDGQAPVGVEADLFESPWTPGRLILRVAVVARHVEVASPAPRHLVFLVDGTPSMDAADRGGLLQRGLHEIAARLMPEDRLSLVTFGRGAGVVLPPTFADDEAAVHEGIARLGVTAGRHEVGGLRAALRLAGDDGEVVIVSDVDPSLPIGDDALDVAASTTRPLHAIGVGPGPHGALAAVAAAGHGDFAVADRMDAMVDALADIADPDRVAVAREVRLTLAFLPERVAAWRPVGDANWSAPEAWSTSPFDLDAGDQRTWLFEVVPLGLGAGDLPLVRLSARGADVAAARDVEGTARPFAHASTDARFATAVAGFALRANGEPDAPSWDWVRTTCAGALGVDAGGLRAEFTGLVGRVAQAPRDRG